MRTVVASLFVLGAAIGADCLPPTPQPPGPVGDAAPFDAGGSLCAVACRNLAELGCAEGAVPNCASVCEHAQAERVTDLHPVCLSLAHTKAEARACRSVKCD